VKGGAKREVGVATTAVGGDTIDAGKVGDVKEEEAEEEEKEEKEKEKEKEGADENIEDNAIAIDQIADWLKVNLCPIMLSINKHFSIRNKKFD